MRRASGQRQWRLIPFNSGRLTTALPGSTGGKDDDDGELRDRFCRDVRFGQKVGQIRIKLDEFVWDFYRYVFRFFYIFFY